MSNPIDEQIELLKAEIVKIDKTLIDLQAFEVILRKALEATEKKKQNDSSN